MIPLTYPQVSARPYAWPYDGVIDAAHTALVCIDWQTDFCGPGGYVDTMGYDLSHPSRSRALPQEVLAAVRDRGLHDRPHARRPPARPRRLPAQQAVALAADRSRHR